MKILHKNVPLILTRNVGFLQEMNGNHHVKLNCDICYSVSFHTVYPRGWLSFEGQKRVTGGEKMTHAVHMALGVSLPIETVVIIFNLDLPGFSKKINLC